MLLSMNGVKKRFKKEYPGVSVDINSLYEKYKYVYEDQMTFDDPGRIDYNKDCVKWAYQGLDKEKMFGIPSTNGCIWVDECASTSAALASKPTEPPAAPGWYDGVYKEEGNKPMCNSMSFAKCQPSYTTAASSPTVILNAPAEKTESQTQRDYLLNRLDSINRYDGPDLTKMFNLHVDNAPKNFEELIEKITKKQFTISKNAEKILARQKGSDEDDLFSMEDEDYDGRTFFYGPMEGIIWDGPKPDHKGYSEAVSEKNKAYAAAKDIIWVKSPEEGLAALEEFKKWTPSNAPK